MIAVQEGNSFRVRGPLSMQTAGSLLQEFFDVATPGEWILDLAEVTDVDSSALAVIQALHRRSQAQGGNLRVVNSPAGLHSLAALYDVTDFLRIESPPDDVSEALERI